ncbi:MAG: hypothetical protein ACLGI6_13405, partial [Gammaproteobacteria bacterium]
IAVRRFVHAVDVYFHGSGEQLPDNFTDALSTHIHRTKSHIAVLNYDNLLYDALYASEVLRGYDGALIDGFRRDGFAPANLERFYPARLGYYLHLHGSPLFIGAKKVMRGGREFLEPAHESHIVLTHVKHKPSIINSSPILSEYWNQLGRALDEVACIVLFGYSGEDLHLNQKIMAASHGKTIHLIEWRGAGTEDARRAYWTERFKGRTVNVIRLDDVLDFRDWARLN